MLPPIQNQEVVQRSGQMSEMRSQEQGKFFGDMAKAAAEMHRLEALKENTVQKGDDSEALNPDGGGQGGQQQQKNKQNPEEETPETNTPAGHPLKLEGGDVIDLMA